MPHYSAPFLPRFLVLFGVLNFLVGGIGFLFIAGESSNFGAGFLFGLGMVVGGLVLIALGEIVGYLSEAAYYARAAHYESKRAADVLAGAEINRTS